MGINSEWLLRNWNASMDGDVDAMFPKITVYGFYDDTREMLVSRVCRSMEASEVPEAMVQKFRVEAYGDKANFVDVARRWVNLLDGAKEAR